MDVARRFDDAAAAGNDLPAAPAHLGGRLRLDGAESCLAVTGEDVRDGAARLLFNDLVQIHELLAQRLGKAPADGGLAAARHPDEGHVGLPGLQVQKRLADDHLFIQQLAGEMFRGVYRLRYQHFQTAEGGDAPLSGAQHQLGAEGIVHHIQHRFQAGEGVQIHRAVPVAGVHPHRGGVDEDVHLLVGGGLRVGERAVFAAAAGGENLRRAAVGTHGGHRVVGAAAA